MLDGLKARYHAVLRRVRRFERREVREFRRWVEHTGNLIHLSILLFAPLLIAGVTALSNSLDLLPFVLFPTDLTWEQCIVTLSGEITSIRDSARIEVAVAATSVQTRQ